MVMGPEEERRRTEEGLGVRKAADARVGISAGDCKRD
jgi:hypothetical protein